MKNSRELALGIDFGTSKVKATVLDYQGRLVASNAIGWSQAGASRSCLADWLLILKRTVRALSSHYIGLDRRISAIGITAVAPCLVVVNPDCLEWSSPLVQYDEQVLGVGHERRNRTVALAKILERLAPRSLGDRASLLTANGWLCWQLTGCATIDRCSIVELGLDVEGRAVVPGPPSKSAAPGEAVGSLIPHMADALGLRSGIAVVAGGSDSLGLAVASRLPRGGKLIYLGTFFSVMEARRDFSRAIPVTFRSVPYAWHISFPGGAIIERLASALHSRELSRPRQIEAFLKSAALAANDSNEPLDVHVRKWVMGKTTPSLPVVKSPSRSNSRGVIALAPIRTFAEAAREHFKSAEVRNVRVAGGLSNSNWLTHYIEEIAEIRLIARPTIQGAEGAALLALATQNEFPTLASES